MAATVPAAICLLHGLLFAIFFGVLFAAKILIKRADGRFFTGLLPNGLFDEKFDGLCGIFITIFDVYLKDKRKKFYKNYAELANFWQ